MPLNIVLSWHPPLDLVPSENGLIYDVDLEEVPRAPGIYIFGREWGGNVTPHYVGKATNLESRMRQQLNNLKLMKSLRDTFKRGQRIVLVATLVPKRGQSTPSLLSAAEKAYIEHALTAGYDLFNVSGTAQAAHKILSSGRKAHHAPFPRKMNLRVR